MLFLAIFYAILVIGEAMKPLLVATKNIHKIKEIKNALEPLGFCICSLLDFEPSMTIEETGSTFEENAYLKAIACFQTYHIPTLADDSGLEVFALHMRPGVYSQRYSTSGTDQDNLDKLLLEMNDITDRRARFVAVLCYIGLDKKPIYIREECYGEIASKPVYQNGFGYDPIFFLPIQGHMFSQLTIDEKNQISHRGKALHRLRVMLGGL